jgi:GNAT superfamily N-acetyltransferase
MSKSKCQINVKCPIQGKVKSQKIKGALREATDRDIPHLSKHHRKMFEEIWERKGEHIDISIGKGIEKAYRQKLKQELTGGSCKAWVIENEDRTIASGAVTIVSFVPTPKDVSSRVAYLHSMYTEKGSRNNRFASLIVEKAIQYCKDNGIKCVFLNASEAGRPIYEKIGFRSAPEMMRLDIK